jgi:CheY-like chemotaxis protein
VFNPDADLVSRLAPHIERVLIVDPYEASAKTAAELMRALGAWRVEVCDGSRRAYQLAESYDPHFVLTEFDGPGIDGIGFTRALRRSAFNCRRRPVVVASAQARASSVSAARDSGAHEFLRKPFSAADLRRRVENVALKARPWIEAVGYVGPDRRRFNSGAYAGAKRRNADRKGDRPQSETERFVQALAILHAAINRFDTDPVQATRAIRTQIETLAALSLALRVPRLVHAVAALDRYLATASHSGSRRMLHALLEEGENPLSDLSNAAGMLGAPKKAFRAA